jgi:hypothetical protein
VVAQFRIDHGPGGVESLVRRCLALEPDPAEVRVVLETRHGLLVEALLDAGFSVVPVNPDLVARRRGPARKKDDAEDARICCLLALDRHTSLRQLVPHGDLGTELRAIARDDERAARDERRLLNRLRADLMVTYPAALALSGNDLGAVTILRLLEKWHSQAELAGGGARTRSTVSCCLSAAGLRFSGRPTPGRHQSTSRSAYQTETAGLDRVRGYHVPHGTETTGEDALCAPETVVCSRPASSVRTAPVAFQRPVPISR